MYVTTTFGGVKMRADLSRPIDTSIPLRVKEGPNCFWAPQPDCWPVEAGAFVGDTRRGGAVNFFTVQLNPHGNGTHTECVGHLTRERISIQSVLTRFHHVVRLVTIQPQRQADGDRVLTCRQLADRLPGPLPPAVMIRTLPNDEQKCRMNYSGTNPPYLEAVAAAWLAASGVEHLLTDLPSVDRESDGGRLAAHRAFWHLGADEGAAAVRRHATITELVYVPPMVQDGLYLLNLQIAGLELDASPSKPVLYVLEPMG
ncbi:MAG: hypothetical protein RLY31_1629 [Bacteroidota bacterium]